MVSAKQTRVRTCTANSTFVIDDYKEMLMSKSAAQQVSSGGGRPLITDASGDPYGLQRPGYRFAVEAASAADSSRQIEQGGNKPIITDGTNNALGLHRPGWRIAAGGSERDVLLRDSQRKLIEEAHAEYLDDLTNAWRGTQSTDDRGRR
jgi:hypothetical protein